MTTIASATDGTSNTMLFSRDGSRMASAIAGDPQRTTLFNFWNFGGARQTSIADSAAQPPSLCSD